MLIRVETRRGWSTPSAERGLGRWGGLEQGRRWEVVDVRRPGKLLERCMSGKDGSRIVRRGGFQSMRVTDSQDKKQDSGLRIQMREMESWTARVGETPGIVWLDWLLDIGSDVEMEDVVRGSR